MSSDSHENLLLHFKMKLKNNQRHQYQYIKIIRIVRKNFYMMLEKFSKLIQNHQTSLHHDANDVFF